MTHINQNSFAEKIKEYLLDVNSFNEKSIEETLSVPYKEIEYFEGRPVEDTKHNGIRFGYTTELVMQLFKRAYDGLETRISEKEFSQSMAETMQYFANQFKNKDRYAHLCYPHFLLHGIDKQTLDEVVDKFRNNARIIHETLNVQKDLMKKVNRSILEKIEKGERICENYVNILFNGLADDYFGISHCLFHNNQITIGSGSGYVAKVSFFLDETNLEMYVILVQGGRFGNEKVDVSAEERRRRWNEVQKITGKDPRTFLLTKTKELGKNLGMKRIRVIRPQHHPMFIECHKGFTGKYEPVIINAGITNENECYLEEVL